MRFLAVALTSLAALALAPGTGAQSPTVVDVFSSLPLQGASRDQTRATVNGMRLALSEVGGVAGAVQVRYTSLDDSTAKAGNWDPTTVARNARRAVRKTSTVAYLGEFNSGATKISLPMLNAAGIAQVSPSNTYDGLTVRSPQTEPGEPEKYQPGAARSFVRLLPNDTVQAAALAAKLAKDGCKRVAIANDGDAYGKGLASGVAASARSRGVAVVVNRTARGTAGGAKAFARRATAARFDCFAFGGVTANGAVRIATEAFRANRRARFYGGDGICESGFTSPRRRGVAASLGKRFTCTVAVLDLADYPGGPAFARAYRAKFGSGAPDPYAILGYEAMKLVLDTITTLGPGASDRAQVRAALLATKDRASALGPYSFDANGDTTSRRYGLYRVDRSGSPSYAGSVVG